MCNETKSLASYHQKQKNKGVKIQINRNRTIGKKETKNGRKKVMKTNFKTKQKSSYRNVYVQIITAVIIFGICIFNVNAQNFMHSISEYIAETNQVIAIETRHSDLNYASSFNPKANNLISFAGYLETETEEPLKLEEWMTNEANFYTALTIETEAENAMELENWMMNEKLFDGTAFSVITETEEKLELESWMTDENRFSVEPQNVKKNSVTTETFIFQDEEEKDLEVEAWMLNSNLF